MYGFAVLTDKMRNKKTEPDSRQKTCIYMLFRFIRYACSITRRQLGELRRIKDEILQNGEERCLK